MAFGGLIFLGDTGGASAERTVFEPKLAIDRITSVVWISAMAAQYASSSQGSRLYPWTFFFFFQRCRKVWNRCACMWTRVMVRMLPSVMSRDKNIAAVIGFSPSEIGVKLVGAAGH